MRPWWAAGFKKDQGPGVQSKGGGEVEWKRKQGCLEGCLRAGDRLRERHLAQVMVVSLSCGTSNVNIGKRVAIFLLRGCKGTSLRMKPSQKEGDPGNRKMYS